MSYAPPVPEGAAHTLSRVAAIVMLLMIPMTLSLGAMWFILALLSGCAFESNRYRVSSIVRLLSVVLQVGAILGLVALGMTVAFLAESGRDAPFLRGVIILVVVGIVVMVLPAFVGALGTLRSSVAEP